MAAERLVQAGALVDYEPRLTGVRTHPDLVATWDGFTAAFEVVFPVQSQQDLNQDKRLGELLSECARLLSTGTLDIYMASPDVSPGVTASILPIISQFSTDRGSRQEVLVSDSVYIAYDPNLHSLPAPDERGEMFPITDPNYHQVKAKLGILMPMSAQILVNAHRESGCRSVSAKLIVRGHRPVVDSRAFSKVDQEYSQLPPGVAGVVVIDMSRTGMRSKPEEWAKDIHESFGPGFWNKLSAVWLRSGFAQAGAEWQDLLTLNPHATTKLPIEIVYQIIRVENPPIWRIPLRSDRASRLLTASIAAPFFLPQWHQREYLTQRYPRHIWRFVFADAFLLVAAHGRIISRQHVPLPADCDRFEVNHPVVLRDLLYGELNR